MALRYFAGLSEMERVGDIAEKGVDAYREELLKVPAALGNDVYAKLSPKQAIETYVRLRREIAATEKAGQKSLGFEKSVWSLEEAKCKAATMTRKTAIKHL